MDLSDSDWKEFTIISSRVAFYVSFLPIIIGFLKRKHFSNSIKIFYLYLIVDLLIAFVIQLFIWSVAKFPDTLVPIVKELGITSTNFFIILYNINVVGVLGWYFSSVISAPKISKPIKWASWILVLLMILNYFFIEGYQDLGVFNPTAASICGFVFPLIHLWYLFRQDYQLVLARNPYFWIALGLVVATLLGLFQSIAGDQLFKTDYPLFAKFNISKNGLIIISFLFFGISFWQAENTAYLREDIP